ncbi:Hypothetical predicted protein [Octopus vulgaris]|uniref:Uncharacterized protein n=1 Tax=Octopus vulgaris TaxID=6645 RepID=A0AA36AN17_OCTVU|nr:Hypothetical predicted protein [Octopus vulgaris]
MACLKSSALWGHVLKLQSNTRARLHEDPLSEDFMRDIRLLGNGEVPEDVDITVISNIRSLRLNNRNLLKPKQ